MTDTKFILREIWN